MIYVGIDIAKQKHFAAAVNSDSEVLVQPFSFENSSKGFNLLVSKLDTFKTDDIVIGLESTAHYGDALVFYLFNLGYQLTVINPIQTSALRKTNIRKTKTDEVDTFLIIKSMMVNGYHLFVKADASTLRLKSLCRFY